MVFPLLVVLASNLISPESLPQISIQSWAQYDDWKFDSSSPLPVVFGNTSSSVFAIPASVGGIVILCNASYPIEWNFHPHQLGSFGAPVRGSARGAAVVSSTRLSNDIFNPSSFEYQSEVKILGSSNIMTGNYTCQAVNSPDIASSIYIYWEGSSPPFLTLAGMNISVTWDNDAKQVLLPCKVSRPDIIVDLYQTTHNDTLPLPANNSIVYDSMRGFILSDLPNPIGQYKCIANNEPGKDYLVVNVVASDNKVQTESGNKLLRPASFNFDETKSQFVCCSSQENKPPAMVHYYCEHPISCQLRKDSLIDIENAGRRLGSRCTAITLYVPLFGVVRCVGEGVDIVRTYMFPVGVRSTFGRRMGSMENNLTIPQPYYNWDSIDSDQMIQIKPPSEVDSAIYASQNYTFGCQFSTAYFSHGIRWMISWKNNTNIVLEEAVVNKTGSRGFRQIFKRNLASVVITADMELDSVACFAPVWNTTEWKNKSLPLSVKEPVEPLILGKEVELHEWYLNDTNKVISCNFSGKPEPRAVWKKDNKTYSSMNVENELNSSAIIFSRVSHETHGEYSCIVTNFKGSSVKTFRVIVYEQGSVQVGILIGVVIVGLILIITGSGLLAWKLYKQKRIINHLAGAAFKEVHETQNGGGREHITAEPPSTIGLQASSDVTIQPQDNFNGVASKYEDGNYHKL